MGNGGLEAENVGADGGGDDFGHGGWVGGVSRDVGVSR